MIEIKRRHIVLFLFFAIALIAISGCAKAECRTSADCSPRTCFQPKCEGKKCAYTIQSNCCGNRINDTIEDGKPGSQCTCPQDYGKCEGKGKVKVGSRTDDATYAHYYCNANSQCVLGVEKTDIAPQNFLDTIDIGLFRASSVARYNRPFDAKRDSFEFTVTLDNVGKDLVLPIILTKVRLLFSSEYARTEQLIAEHDLSAALNGVGDSAAINAPLNLNYKPYDVEETGGLRYVIDYVYKKKSVSGKTANGTNIYSDETVRASFTAPVKPVFFVRSG